MSTIAAVSEPEAVSSRELSLRADSVTEEADAQQAVGADSDRWRFFCDARPSLGARSSSPWGKGAGSGSLMRLLRRGTNGKALI